MSFRDIQTSIDVENYQAKLVNGYPDRPDVVAQIINLLNQIEPSGPNILDLCVGPGQLATALCKAIPNIQYVGLDFMQPFLDYVAGKLPSNLDARFLCADLTSHDWPQKFQLESIDTPFDAIVSMQSLHDVGGQDRAQKIYEQSYQLLNEKGIFVNADLIIQEGEEANARPGRLTVPLHLKLLKNAGFTTVDCSFRTSQFGICYGIK